YVIGVCFLAGGVAAARMIPAPAWFVVLDLAAAYVPMAFLGTLLGRRIAGPKSRVNHVVLRPPVMMEEGNGKASEEHDLPLVRRRRGGRGTLLRRDVPRLLRRCGPPRACGLPVREERGRADGRVHRDGHPLPRPQRRAGVQAQRGVLVPGRDRRPG